MNIYLNGNAHEITASMAVSELLESIGYGGKPVVVELNGQAIFPRDFPSTPVEDGACVEVVTLAAGG